MKQKLLFSILVLFLVFHVRSQLPPPCGLSPIFVCDEDGDSQVQVNLRQAFPFQFCPYGPSQAVHYYPLTYYLSEEDANNSVNPIQNPEMYLTTVGSQSIFRRADPINPDTHSILIAYDGLEVMVPPSPQTPSPLYACTTSSDGYAVFNLNTKINEIRSGQDFNYEIRFFETLSDAENLTNPIANIYNNIIPYQQTIYASMYVWDVYSSSNESCLEVVPLDLIVGECEDISVNLLPGPNNPRPGFDHINKLFIQNLGGNTATGSVEFIHDVSVLFLNAVSSNPNDIITVTSNGFTVDFMDLEPGDSEFITISLSCPPSTVLGTLLTNSANIINNSDNDSINDTSSLTQVVIGSFDPNDKLESHGPTILIDDFTSNDYLFYTIRFQNVGTADAINIKIEDVLDDQVDESTFQMIRASHNYTVLRTANNLEWNFNGIHLPSEDMDEENSHGYVYFKVKPNAGYAIGDIIPNTAAIYFDFNSPIITNTFETEFEQTLNVNGQSISQFSIYPNPASDVINIHMNGSLLGTFNVEVFDVQGKQVLSQTSANESAIQLNVSSLESGLYFIKMKTELNESIKKLIVN